MRFGSSRFDLYARLVLVAIALAITPALTAALLEERMPDGATNEHAYMAAGTETRYDDPARRSDAFFQVSYSRFPERLIYK